MSMDTEENMDTEERQEKLSCSGRKKESASERRGGGLGNLGIGIF